MSNKFSPGSRDVARLIDCSRVADCRVRICSLVIFESEFVEE